MKTEGEMYSVTDGLFAQMRTAAVKAAILPYNGHTD